MALIDMVLVLLLIYVFLRAHREPLSWFVLGPRRPGRELLLGVALIPAAFFLVVAVLAVILAIKPSLHNVAVNPFERMLQTPRDAAIFAVVVMLAGGVREEVQRAFIVRRFDQYLGGAVVGIVVYSIIFGLGHIEQGYAAAIATGIPWAGLGRDLLAPAEHHRADHQPRRVQPAAAGEVRELRAVGGAPEGAFRLKAEGLFRRQAPGPSCSYARSGPPPQAETGHFIPAAGSTTAEPNRAGAARPSIDGRTRRAGFRSPASGQCRGPRRADAAAHHA